MQNISRELHEMLLHTPAPSKAYRPLVRHLQELDNRRRQFYQRTQTVQARTIQRPLPFSAAPSQPVRPATPVSHESRRETRVAATQPSSSGDAMDLSIARRHSRTDRETGACFRCHKTGHRVRDCQVSDSRPQDVQRRDALARELRSLELRLERPYMRSRSPSRSPSLSDTPASVRNRDRDDSSARYQKNEASLAEVVSRR